MSQSNEFKGTSLLDAVQKATFAYRHVNHERKDDGRCNDLLLEISTLKSQIGRIADKAESLADDAEQLRRSASIDLALSALAGLGTIARALRGFSRIARRIKRMDASRLTRDEIVDLLSTLGPIGAAVGAVYAIEQLIEAQRLASQAEAIESNAEGLGDQLLTAVSEYKRYGCGGGHRFQS